MSNAYASLPKLSVRDNMEDEDLTDIDDEVFIRDGRNGSLKLDDDGGVKRPLMAPRRKCKKSSALERPKCSRKAFIAPMCYGLIALFVLLGLIALCIVTAHLLPMPMTMLKSWFAEEEKAALNESEIIPCTSLASKIVWTRTLPKLISEAPLRSNDINGDNIEDIIIGFSTGLDTVNAPEYVCSLYFKNQSRCMGGVLALDGKTGANHWIHWTAHAIFSVDCSLDVTDDKIKDCVISGRSGLLHTINGKDGKSIWEVPLQDSPPNDQSNILDVYDAKFIADSDGDGIGDVIASHSMQSGSSRSSEILILSGKNGKIIRNVNLSNKEQLFIAPQTLVHPDGENIFVIVTSSQRHAGGLYIVPEVNLLYGDTKLRKLHHDTGKGVLLPPILADINSDGTQDIISAMFNSTIMAYDGLTFNPIWNYTVPNSEVISIPIPGYYNDDDVPDFMVKHQIGSGFPTYYYTVATVIDGRTGTPLLEKPMEDSASRQMSGLSVTVEGFGNDWFLHWSADCLKYEGSRDKYQFLKGESLMSQTRADLCKLRFNSTLITNLFALSQHVGPPGISLYYSENWKSLEFNNSADLQIEIERKMENQPEPAKTVTAPASEKPATVPENERKESIFRHKGDSILSEITDKLSENAYESADGYKNKQPEINLDEDVDDFNVYDDLYDTDNVDNDRNIVYSRASEVRAQRSRLKNKARQEGAQDVASVQGDYNDDEEKYAMVPANDTNLFKEDADLLENILLEPPANEHVIDDMEKRDIDSSGNYGNELLRKRVIASKIKNGKLTSKTDNSFAGTVANKLLGKDSSEKGSSNIGEDIPNTRSQVEWKTLKKPLLKYLSPTAIGDDENDARLRRIFQRESSKNQQKVTDRSRLNVENTGENKLRKKRIKRKAHSDSDSVNKNEGIQRQPPTGILLPSFEASKTGKVSMDLVFSTFWLPSSDVSAILIQEDLDCISRKRALLENAAQYKEGDEVVAECLAERGVDYKQRQDATDGDDARIALGQTTVYRTRLECVCPEDMLPHQTCRDIAPRQSWPEHLGKLGNGYFEPMRKTRA